jgi:hypothetical protein
MCVDWGVDALKGVEKGAARDGIKMDEMEGDGLGGGSVRGRVGVLVEEPIWPRDLGRAQIWQGGRERGGREGQEGQGREGGEVSAEAEATGRAGLLDGTGGDVDGSGDGNNNRFDGLFERRDFGWR